MKKPLRILAILIVICMTLSLFGCLVNNKANESVGEADETGPVSVPEHATAAPTEQTEPTDETYDFDAVAIELGSVKIKANDVVNSLSQYLDMFSYYGEIDEDLIAQSISLTEEEIVRYYLPLWKADELGLKLSAEKEAELAQKADADVESDRNYLLCQFAYYYGGADDLYDDASLLTADQKNTALDEINAQLAMYYYDGFLFDDYLEMEHESYLTGYRIEAFNELLKEQVSTAPLSDEQVDEWYRNTLETQQSKYDASPDEFYYDWQANESDATALILYVPDGFLRVQVIELVPEGTKDAKIEENAAVMKTLEAEYGALALNGGDAARLAEIESDHAALLAENTALEDAYFAAVRTKSAEAYSALQGGASFEDAMQTYNAPDEEGSGFDERIVYAGDVDKHNGELSELAKTLREGEYSEPTLIDDTYVIVKLVEVLKEGPVDRASIENEIRAAAAASLAEEAFDEQLDAWYAEAMQIAVFHRETYESVAEMYLYY